MFYFFFIFPSSFRDFCRRLHLSNLCFVSSIHHNTGIKKKEEEENNNTKTPFLGLLLFIILFYYLLATNISTIKQTYNVIFYFVFQSIRFFLLNSREA